MDSALCNFMLAHCLVISLALTYFLYYAAQTARFYKTICHTFHAAICIYHPSSAILPIPVLMLILKTEFDSTLHASFSL